LDAERKRVLRQYLVGIDKLAALVLRFCSDPQRVSEYIGPQQAEVYLQWRAAILEAGDLRPKFTAKPDSQLKLDAAQERRTWLNIYNFAAKDPQVNRAAILRKLFTLLGEDPTGFVTDQMPEQKPEPSLGWSFKGEDVNPMSAQYPIVLEILAQAGIQISPEALQEAQAGAQTAMLAQMAGGLMSPTGASPKAATSRPAAHGGLPEKMGPLSKEQSSQTGERSGPSVGVQ
jgi:hypothetical protein